ncbi:LysM peptidoglycan-binding domain-containing protein [Pokkaliibacter sp. MBI-7]|uniref:LysM peptidoglycan-binding domain-containing protein n=1 Tax=Pokkaliibacter sp. MBI-7 TaxID=3040600 RepID=UPI00244BE7A5|nr:LysM peptidoglycan-binding domain-containing protein [Pokkaliibacter sp. MBI-7]MDH2433163.1 LysM peptidoglycan-binding domain-containing protein [Pokkaliibacter sp. MBI-7]
MRKLLISVLLCFSAVVYAEQPALKNDAPTVYQVVKGDTLWHITGRFFSNPWLWPKIWAKNPQIANPHWIYPGDEIFLVKVNGQPRLALKRGDAYLKATGSGVGDKVKLLPQMRVANLSPVPTLPVETIAPFLRSSLVIKPGELDKAPYVVGTDDQRLLSAAGQLLYVRGTLPYDEGEWRLYRPGSMLTENLGEKKIAYGQEAKYIATLKLETEAESGDIHKFEVLHVAEEIRSGDRLVKMPADDPYAPFAPSYPADPDVKGRILAVPSGVAYTGRNDIVILNVGEDSALEPGNILQINAAGEQVKDPFTKEVVTLPDSRAGVLMVFKVFDHTSYALVLKAERTLRVGDKVVSPDY